jgi:cellulose synthase/poly-beta-1,6-N-acetylglucosamine synthase-like glycosyltransferase
MTAFTIVLLVLYTLVLGTLLLGFFRQPETKQHIEDPALPLSIVIVFRNEERHIGALLQSLSALEYPRDLFELLLVDDHSTDGSVEVVSTALSVTDIQWSLLQNEQRSGSPKKDAISLAVKNARYSWLLTTDADCVVPPGWLRGMASFIQSAQPRMIYGPVGLMSGPGLLRQFQLLEHLALQTTTIGAFGLGRPVLCNGANLGFLKSDFVDLGGYSGNDHLASGDDIFLMEKFRRAFPRRVLFIKNTDVIVKTQPADTWRAMITQRIRWAAKSAKQPNVNSKGIGGIVLFTNLTLAITILFSLAVHQGLPSFILYVLLFKLLLDLSFVAGAAFFFKAHIKWGYVVPANLIYPFVSSWAGLRSLSGGYRWKERTFKR